MWPKYCIVLAVSLVLQSTMFTSAGQNGYVEGLITDRVTSETIPGAHIVVEGTVTGTSSDLNGRYRLSLPEGVYTLRIMFISYQTVIAADLAVKAGETTTLNVELEEVSTEIAGVEVTARRITNTEASMISSIRGGNVVIAGISAQQIVRSQDNDAAAVVKRIPGVTIVDDRFILIRGLSERYNPAMLHESYAPSMEADVKSFSFDIVPAGLIDRIMIYKSPSPELPGDFSGGLVRIYTKSVPETNFLSLSWSAGYDNSTSLKTFYGQEKGKGHWSGLYDDLNGLPASFPANLRSIASDPVRIQEAGRSLRNNWKPLEYKAGLNQGFSLSGGLTLGKGQVKAGNITSLNYSNSRSVDNILRRDYNQYDSELGQSSVIYSFNDNRYAEKIRTGILHNWSISIGGNHKIELVNIFNQVSQSEYIFRTGPMYEFNYYANNHSFYQLFRGIYSGQLTGRHELAGEKTVVEWSASVSESYRREPDYRRYRMNLDTASGDLSIYIPTGAAATYFLGRFYSEMEENGRSASVKLTQKLFAERFVERAPELAAGLFMNTGSRFFRGRNLGYVKANSALFNQDLINSSIDELFSPDNINPDTGIKIDEQTNSSDSYSSRNIVSAGFVLARFSLAEGRVNVTAGARAESGNMMLESRTLTNEPVNVHDSNFDILPSLNLSYNLTEKSLARLGFGKTINRAEFRELAPFGFYDFNYNLVRKGNPDLRSAVIWNLDLRWEYYPAQGEIITGGLFYKNFTDAIELTFIPGGGTAGIKTFIPVNAESASGMGAELEVRKSLSALSAGSFADKLTIMFNSAFIYSRIRPESGSAGQFFRERPMQGQSPYIVNTGIYYRDQEAGLQVNLLYNIIGRRIMIIGFEEYPDIYEMPRHLAELTITKSIGRFLEIKAGVKDLFNQENLLLQDANRDGRFDRRNDQVIERYSPGRIFSMGLSFRLQ